jgi:hypothetical protein
LGLQDFDSTSPDQGNTLVPYQELIAFVRSYRSRRPGASKQQIVKAASAALGLRKRGAVYAGDGYAVQFSESNTSGFSGVVCSLRRIQEFDGVPLVVAVVCPGATEFLLANATFINKVSHSSQRLSVDRVRGSILGSNIMRAPGGLANQPENFAELFAMHQEFTWQENFIRLVEATRAIAGRGKRFEATEAERAAILRSPGLAANLLTSPEYRGHKRDLSTLVHERSIAILGAAEIENVNLRGNRIEQLITGGINEHNLADTIRHVGEIELQLEIKTKLMDRASSPKAYNVDKALAALGTGQTLVAFCLVGIHVGSGRVTASTVSIFDETVLAATRVQSHWAGRNSRGVTQLTGNLAALFDPAYQERIDVPRAQQFLQGLLSL